VFIVAGSRERGHAELAFKPKSTPDELELEGARLGQWPLGSGETSFVRGLHHSLDEAEIARKISLGY